MKKIITILIMITMMATLAGCGTDVEVSKIEEIKQAGKLVLGTSAGYPPYEFHKEVDGKDTIVGFDIDIAKEIAKDLGVELEVKDLKFDGLLAALNAGTVDIIIAGMTPTEERKEKVDFSQVYYIAKQSIAVNVEKEGLVKTIDDLKDKKLGVQKGAIQEKIAKSYVAESQIKALGKVSDVMLELINNKVDAIIVEEPVAKAYADKNAKVVVLDIQLDTEDSGSAVAIKKGNKTLVKAIDETLEKLIKEGTIDKFVIEATEMVEE